MTEWIPVNQSLPNNHENCWITDLNSQVHQGLYYTKSKAWEIDIEYCKSLSVEKAIAWMSLEVPKPYKAPKK